MRSMMIFLLSFAVYAFGQSEIKLRTIQLDAPTYLSITGLNILLTEDVISKRGFLNSTINLNFELTSGALIQETIVPNRDKLLDCLKKVGCELGEYFIPLEYHARACSLEISLVGSGNSLLSKKIIWGACKKINSHLTKDIELYSSKLNLRIKDINLPIELGKYQTLSIDGKLFDSNVSTVGIDYSGEIIWSSNFNNELETDLISPKVFRKLCEVHIVADFNGTVPDVNLSNNGLRYKLGLCEYEGKDRFVDITGVNSNNQLFIFNQNDASTKSEILTHDFRLYDSENKLQMKFKKHYPDRLDYLDFNVFNFAHLLNQDRCRLEVYLNSNFTVKESNFENNHIFIDKCAELRKESK